MEIVPAAEDPYALATVVAGFADMLDAARFGLKIRTGGITRAEIPDPASVATFICACRDNAIPFKATAGLHHPFYHFSEEVGTMMHGFLNFFAGSIVAVVHDLEPQTLTHLLRCSDPSDLTFDDDGLTFADYSASLEDIRRVRQTIAISFGSCSFDEPREDLLAMGLATITT